MSTTDASPGTTREAGRAGPAPTTSSSSPAAPLSEPPRGPVTLEEIRVRIGEVRDELAAWFAEAPVDPLFHREPGAWAAIDDLRHLVRVNAALVKGLGYPRIVLRARFGRPARRSWSYERLAVIYDALLTTGVKSPALFDPRTGVVADRTAYRETVLERWRSVNGELLGRAAAMTERRADRTALPHPGLGLLTVREMLFFTIHHDLHHLAVAKRRLADAAGSRGSGPAPNGESHASSTGDRPGTL